MRRLLLPTGSPWPVAVSDCLAILSFAIVGVISHRGALPASALAEDALPLLTGWFAVAVPLGLYVRGTWRALLLTWAIGIPAGVLLRAAVLGKLGDSRQLAFLATTLVLSLAFVLAARAIAGWTRIARAGTMGGGARPG